MSPEPSSPHPVSGDQPAFARCAQSARLLRWCLCCLVAGVIVGYSIGLRSESESSYRNHQYGEAICASESIWTATDLLALLRAGKTVEMQAKLREQIKQRAAELREHHGEYTARELYHADPALQAADAELNTR